VKQCREGQLEFDNKHRKNEVMHGWHRHCVLSVVTV